MTTCLIVISGGAIEFILQGDQREEARARLKNYRLRYIEIIRIFKLRVFILSFVLLYYILFLYNILFKYKFVQIKLKFVIYEMKNVLVP